MATGDPFEPLCEQTRPQAVVARSLDETGKSLRPQT